MYKRQPENNTTPAVFYYNFGTTIISDINNNIPGTILPEKNWGIGDFGDLKAMLVDVAKRGGSFIGLKDVYKRQSEILCLQHQHG